MNTRHPRPWRIEVDEAVNPSAIDGSFIIYNADNGVVINGGTYSHDDDEEVNLSHADAVELVDMANEAEYLKAQHRAANTLRADMKATMMAGGK